MRFSKSDSRPLGVHKQKKRAYFEPVSTEFRPFHHMYAISCALRMDLGALWWLHQVTTGMGVDASRWAILRLGNHKKWVAAAGIGTLGILF